VRVPNTSANKLVLVRVPDLKLFRQLRFLFRRQLFGRVPEVRNIQMVFSGQWDEGVGEQPTVVLGPGPK